MKLRLAGDHCLLTTRDENAQATPLLIQEGWRAQRRGGYPRETKLQVAISTTPYPLLN